MTFKPKYPLKWLGLDLIFNLPVKTAGFSAFVSNMMQHLATKCLENLWLV
jgi:hypothetical protein